MSITFSGLGAILSALDNTAQFVKDQTVPMYVEAADSTLADAASNAPVLTGDLRDSGHLEYEDNGNDWSIKVTFGDGNGYSKYGKADGYSWFQELGTRFISPRPYLGPAFDLYSTILYGKLLRYM